MNPRNVHTEEHRNFRLYNFVNNLPFHTGPLPDEDTNKDQYNGVFMEDLLHAIEDRLKEFNSGPYRCKENAMALTHIQEAQNWLKRRELRRAEEGILGTYEVGEGEG